MSCSLFGSKTPAEIICFADLLEFTHRIILSLPVDFETMLVEGISAFAVRLDQVDQAQG